MDGLDRTSEMWPPKYEGFVFVFQKGLIINSYDGYMLWLNPAAQQIVPQIVIGILKWIEPS
jgi:hypothetical protein